MSITGSAGTAEVFWILDCEKFKYTLTTSRVDAGLWECPRRDPGLLLFPVVFRFVGLLLLLGHFESRFSSVRISWRTKGSVGDLITYGSRRPKLTTRRQIHSREERYGWSALREQCTLCVCVCVRFIRALSQHLFFFFFSYTCGSYLSQCCSTGLGSALAVPKFSAFFSDFHYCCVLGGVWLQE